jgi:hypothetical protein
MSFKFAPVQGSIYQLSSVDNYVLRAIPEKID